MTSKLAKTLPLVFLISGCGAPLVESMLKGKTDTLSAKATSNWKLVKRATLSIPHPGFMTLENTGNAYSLYVSSFDLFGLDDGIRMIENVGSKINDATEPKLLNNRIPWPNALSVVPREVLGFPALAVPSGFLVPGKPGAVSLVPLNQPDSAIRIAEPQDGWFFHHIEWCDMNGDGRLDAVTARAKVSLFGKKGELLWLEQPEVASRGPWKQHVIAQGPDCNFRVVDLDHDGSPEILATQFFTNKLSLLYSEGGVYKTRVLDESIGAAFDLTLADANGDGRQDLLVTNHASGSNGAVFAYEIPSDIRTGKWTRHTLLSGIKTNQQGPNQGSPGTITTFLPEKSAVKPFILVSGDGSQRAHLLVPAKLNDPTNWTYQENIVVDAKCTVGESVVADVDGDGNQELFTPAYDKSKVFVFSLQKDN